MRKIKYSRYFWVLGGLALGGLAAVIIGFFVFWVFPTAQKARSPIGEYAAPPIVVRFIKSSSVAQNLPAIAADLRQSWEKACKTLGFSERELPALVYLYVHASPEELWESLAARQDEERTILAATDLLLGRKVEGELGRLACSLAFGRPGNPWVPRGVALYLNDPQYPWAAEAWIWMEDLSPSAIWPRADQLLPKDPWEDLYFQVNAPWTEATITLEKMRVLLETFSQSPRGKTRTGELFAASLVHWILQDFGREGLQQFWKTGTWDKAAAGLKENPANLEQEFLAFLQAQFSAYERRENLLALRHLYSGHPNAALLVLEGLNDEEAQEIKGLAYLALGQVDEAIFFLRGKHPELEKLRGLAVWDYGRFVVVGGEPKVLAWLKQAELVVQQARLIWPDIFPFLPDRLTFYVAEPLDISLPFGTAFVRTGEQIPELTARLILEAVSSGKLPGFDTLVEGTVLWLTHPERDFRQEALRIWQAERWVSLTQPLFGVYPQEVAEGEAGAFAVFIIEQYGPEKFRELWKVLEEGASIFRASEQVLGLSFYALEQELLRWLKQP